MIPPLTKLLLLSALLSSTAMAKSDSELALATTDWMPQGSFTDGIEGPAVGPDGSLYAVNFNRQGSIGRVAAQNQGEVWLQLPAGSTGNSIRFNHDGRMVVADYSGHNIFVIDSTDKKILQQHHNPNMHQPNDIAVAATGHIYASDPDWSSNSGQLWRLNPDGSFTLLEKNMGTTNGIELSPDGTKLYVNESVQRKVYVYDVLPSGDLENKRILIEFADFGLDGMVTDKQGNLYITRYGAGVVLKVSTTGTVLSTIRLKGQHPTNVALSLDGKHGFVTMQKRGAIEFFSVANGKGQLTPE